MAGNTPNAGKLDQMVTFQRRADVADGMGNTKGGWQTLVGSRSAQIAPTRGGEQMIALRLQGVNNFDLTVRSDPDTCQVTTDDRAVDLADPTRVFNIRWIGTLDGRSKQRSRYLLMQVEQGVAEG